MAWPYYQLKNKHASYLRRRLASGEGIVSLGVRVSRCVCVRRISLNGEGGALYPVLSGLKLLIKTNVLNFITITPVVYNTAYF